MLFFSFLCLIDCIVSCERLAKGSAGVLFERLYYIHDLMSFANEPGASSSIPLDTPVCELVRGWLGYNLGSL